MIYNSYFTQGEQPTAPVVDQVRDPDPAQQPVWPGRPQATRPARRAREPNCPRRRGLLDQSQVREWKTVPQNRIERHNFFFQENKSEFAACLTAQSRRFYMKGERQGIGWSFLRNFWPKKRQHITNPLFSLVEIYRKIHKITHPSVCPLPFI